jgi:large subunit ribosomal protein L4
MASVAVYTKTGAKSTAKLSLPKALFSAKMVSAALLKQAYTAGEANARQNLATTKTRTDVRGGGRKPHPQKGTGRARSGSIRNPIWRGGGIIFGPRGNENYSKTLNKSAKRTALVQALSLAAERGRVSVIDDLALDGKAASAARLLQKLDFERGLLVVDEINDKTARALNNLPGISLTSANRLSAADVLKTPALLLSKPALKALEERLGGKS